jgi:hypothetical protein
MSADDLDEMRERFLREARAAARVGHSNVVRVHDVLPARPGSEPLIVMEYVPGRNLRQILDKGPLSPATVAQIGREVLAALVAAHQAQVLHRDVKPSNILISEHRIVLTDFGIAKVAGYQDISGTGKVIGTAQYVAPEIARNEPASPAADLWSLGVTLRECLTGQSAFGRPSPVLSLYAVVHEDLPPVAQSGALQPVLDGLLRKRPNERIDAQHAARLLATARQDFRTGRAPAGPKRTADPVGTRRLEALIDQPRNGGRWKAPLSAIVVLLLVGAAGFAWWRLRTPADPELSTLQAFAGNQKVADCSKIGPLAKQTTRRECHAPGGIEIYWVLYSSPENRDTTRDGALHQSKINSPKGCCLIRKGTSPEGRSGRYIEYIYKASDDGFYYASIWWDDGDSDPGGEAVLNIRERTTAKRKDSTETLRAVWLGWNYRFTD